jgi:hypothetical protein
VVVDDVVFVPMNRRKGGGKPPDDQIKEVIVTPLDVPIAGSLLVTMEGNIFLHVEATRRRMIIL